ncbi:TerD family protein (plasmid) [Deinococcus sp. KNUC1210]|uniref:TerD family protein n=1 Tax=Deinococcus sp. KNUC1210 TaxID=2917691 RepID=UPI001EF0AF31|nr:TerD family protein [Deinococcus sp. KNUC1210]ULH17236.1 TerD family protein [Deinococcus sp. KNUC1210]
MADFRKTETLNSGEKRNLQDLTSSPHLSVNVAFELAGLDISVFGLDDERQLKDDRYFVFYNQPRSPEGEITLAQSAGMSRFEIDLARLPSAVSRLVFTATHDDRPVADAAHLLWSLASVEFDPRPALRREKAVMIAELYRHGSGWKINAVGQGFDGGLKALLEYFGGEASDSPAAAPAAAPMPAPPAPEIAFTPGKSVSLKKAQTINLNKAAGKALTRVTVGLGWDAATHGTRIDLDAGCLVFDERKKDIDKVWFMKLSGQNRAIVHSGDNLTGDGSGDDERISIDLSALSPQVKWLVFTINSFSGQNFAAVRNAFCRLVDDTTGQELARYDLGAVGAATAMIMAKLERTGGSGADDGWHLTALGEPGSGMTVRAMVKPALRLL